MYTQLHNLTLDCPPPPCFPPNATTPRWATLPTACKKCESATSQEKIYEVHLLVSIQLTN